MTSPRYGKNRMKVILNIKNLARPSNESFIDDLDKKHPEYTEGKSKWFHLPSQIYNNATAYGFDGVKEFENNPDEEYVVFEPEQIHILGSKQDIEGFKEFVSKDKPNNQITPQQEQQAQQLYSQYLDTIFPDSKVKDIVYHGTQDIEGFKEFTDREKTQGQVIQQKSSSKDLIEQQVKLQGLYDLQADIVIPGTIKEGETSLNTVSTIDYVAYDVDGNIAILSNESENKSADLAKMWLQKQHLQEQTGVRVFRLYTVAKDGTITQVKKANIEKNG